MKLFDLRVKKASLEEKMEIYSDWDDVREGLQNELNQIQEEISKLDILRRQQKT